MDGKIDPVILSLLSAVLGCILPPLCKLIRFVFIRRKHTQLCNTWHGYVCYTDYEKTIIYRKTVIIKKGIFCDYRIRFFDDRFRYIGKGYMENGFLCISMKSHPNSIIKETTYHRYYISRLLEEGLCFGLWLSTDANNRVTCGGAALSKTDLSDKDIEAKMKENFTMDKTLPIISNKMTYDDRGHAE